MLLNYSNDRVWQDVGMSMPLVGGDVITIPLLKLG